MSYDKTAQIIHDPMPYGRVLLVDDMESNIYVGKGLLASYEIQVDTAQSGYEAIAKIKSGQTYDIIFMDHMMPRMDGIEATKILREMGYTHPIVALTANALTGQEEIFLENGLDAFIPKPIDTRQLNQILNKLIRDKQPHEVVEMARRKRTKNDTIKYEPVVISSALVQAFLRDATKAARVLEEVYEKRGDYTSNDIQNFIIHAHAIKSALINIGEPSLSKYAALLEEWGRAGNVEAIFAEVTDFLNKLRSCSDRLASSIKADDDKAVDTDMPQDLMEQWINLRDACIAYDKKEAKQLTAQLLNSTKSSALINVLNDISRYLLHSSFDMASEAAQEVINRRT
jgi:CheY-like chemotaxis protein/HPt (histidine-containing phosphotransfer) domain-containing protein